MSYALRAGAAAATALALALGASACSTDESGKARSAASSFATALQDGDVTKAPLTSGSAEAAKGYADLVAGLGAVRPKVEVTEVSAPADGKAAATLAYSWAPRAGVAPWTYTTNAPLVKEGDAWKVDYQPAAVAPGATAQTRLATTALTAERGRILGAGGTAIVAERPVVRYGIDKANVPAAQAESSARALAALAKVDADALAQQVAAAGPKAFVEAIVLRVGSADQKRVAAGVGAVPGALGVEGTMALAPTSTFARPLLGSVGQATKEIVDASKGAVVAGDVVGLGGLQQARDAQLRGTPGYRVVSTTADGEPKTLHEAPAVAGIDVTTTLDVALQTRAEQALAQVKPASALVAVRPSTGEIVAAASGPGSQGYSTATLGQYPPGSTFKVVTALALLRAGVTPTTTVTCPPTLTVDGRVFKNYDDYPAALTGSVPFRAAFANSCNTAFMGLRDKADQQSLADAAAGLGLGTAAIGVPAYLGNVPLDANEVEHAASMIGQGEVLASPLGMATVTASVVAGRPVTPVLVPQQSQPSAPASGASSAAATSTAAATSAAPPAKPVTAAEAAALKQLMTAVVTEGSGKALRGIPGALAKTGTAEFGSDTPPKTHAWMIGAKGDLAVAVFVGEGAGGAKTAGPILHTFLAG